jgi:hypothetical protein
MRYLLQIYMPEDGSVWERLSEDQKNALSGEYVALMQDSGVIGGAQLAPSTTATTVRVKDGRALSTDGPFTETKEALGGYYLLDVEDIDAAIALAARIPAARMGGAVEVRPLVEP